ncbi:MAG TPA: hypothetical protein VGD83_05470 [Streptosporangiaceae bacterium]
MMVERPYELAWTPGSMVARVRLRGSSVLSCTLLNRGTAFTPAQREALGLAGLMPEAFDDRNAVGARVRAVPAEKLPIVYTRR